MKIKTTAARHRTNRRQRTTRPIVFAPPLDFYLDGWAVESGWKPRLLRQEIRRSIRNRHHEATLEPDRYKHSPRQPDTYHLAIGSCEITYTIEPDAIVVRGYGWPIDREPLDDMDGGAFFLDNSWFDARKR